jgi:hypothetical protein
MIVHLAADKHNFFYLGLSARNTRHPLFDYLFILFLLVILENYNDFSFLLSGQVLSLSNWECWIEVFQSAKIHVASGF